MSRLFLLPSFLTALAALSAPAVADAGRYHWPPASSSSTSIQQPYYPSLPQKYAVDGGIARNPNNNGLPTANPVNPPPCSVPNNKKMC